MTLKRKNAIIRKVKDITISTTLTLALLGSSAFLQSCEEDEYEVAFSKSVQTYIQEVEPNKFQIVHEEVGEENQESKAYISYINGTTKVLTIEEARQILEQEPPDTLAHLPDQTVVDSSTTSSFNDTSLDGNRTYRVNGNSNAEASDLQTRTYSNGETQYYYHGGSNLSTLLYYSAIGNMLGRQHSYHAPAHFYHSSESYRRSFDNHRAVRSSMITRPRSTSSGFFSGSRSRSFSS
ncbi:MAG: hypothetical protein OHK0057_07640 [Thermoflexibacter sp.]